MSLYTSSTTWGGQCANSDQSPINLSQSSSKPCDLLCELTFDDAYIPQANVIVSDEGLVLQSTSSLGSCKFAGEGYTCNSLLLTHPSHHTIENIQADAEVVAIFTNPSGKYLCVSSLVRINPAQTPASHFLSSFVPYANPAVPYTQVNLGDNWGLFMMVPPAGAYYVYDGSMVTPPCNSTKWVVFKAMINMDSDTFAFLVKTVSPGSRPIQALGDREVYFNDVEHLSGAPMPHDNKTYMRCKRVARKGDDVKPVTSAPLGDTKSKEDSKKKNGIHQWASDQIEKNGFFALLDVLLLLGSVVIGIYYGREAASGPNGMYLILKAQSLASWLRSKFMKPQIVAMTSTQ